MGEFAGQKLNDLDPVNISCGEPGENEEQEPGQKSAHLDSDEDADLDEEAEDIEPGQKETAPSAWNRTGRTAIAWQLELVFTGRPRKSRLRELDGHRKKGKPSPSG